MTRKLLSKPSQEVLSSPTSFVTHTTNEKMSTHRMGSVLEERRDPNFNSWTEIIPERVKDAHKR
jgi:hypothetical protein